jgi:heme/copper-type cytochrome/quinol oxidase subunit 2
MQLQMEFDLLVYLALAAVVLVMLTGAVVIMRTPESEDGEARKLRFAAATFAGITMLFVFVSLLYFAGGGKENSAGQQIFEKGFTAMFTLAGTILGYLFGSANSVEAAPARRVAQRKITPDPSLANRAGR